MPLEERKAAMARIEQLRGGRRLISICNFDRASIPQIDGISLNFREDMKEPLYRVLKETVSGDGQIDVFLYTRGGDTNAVWPIVSLLREYDRAFEVVVPFRAHSSGTMLAIAAKRIIMSPIAELSPIDPTTANQFNPRDKRTKAPLGIGVEDVTAYQEFWRAALESDKQERKDMDKYALLQPYFVRLCAEINPLALGNVHRVYLQIRILAKMLLRHHYENEEQIHTIIDRLTQSYYSHHHMINRYEAEEVLGSERVECSNADMTSAIDDLLRQYENDFELRRPFFLGRYLGDDIEKEARFIGGCVESRDWSYLYETKMKFRQYMNPPPTINIQVQPGQIAPLVPGLPRKYEWQVIEQGWTKNVAPQGVTT
jgi:ATP-dependent protease ClpP protease subunit